MSGNIVSLSFFVCSISQIRREGFATVCLILFLIFCENFVGYIAQFFVGEG